MQIVGNRRTLFFKTETVLFNLRQSGGILVSSQSTRKPVFRRPFHFLAVLRLCKADLLPRRLRA